MASTVLITLRVISELILLLFVGILLRKIGILDGEKNTIVTKFVVKALIPALLVSKISYSVSWEVISAWWPLPVFSVVNLTLGMLISFLLKFVFKPSQESKRLFVMAGTLPNFHSIPFHLVEILCQEGPLSAFKSAQNGLAYVAVYGAACNLYNWTIIYSYVTTKDSRDGHKRLEEHPEENSTELSVMVVENSGKSLENSLDALRETETSNENSKDKSVEWKIQAIISKIGNSTPNAIKRMFNFQSLSAMTGILIGIIPFLKQLFVGKDAPLRIFTSVLDSIGGSAAACILILLGASLKTSFSKSQMKKIFWHTVGVTLIRQIIMPAIGTLMVYQLWQLKILPNDPVMIFVLLVQFATPANTYVQMISQLHNIAQDEIPIMMACHYVTALPFFIIYLTLILKFIL